MARRGVERVSQGCYLHVNLSTGVRGGSLFLQCVGSGICEFYFTGYLILRVLSICGNFIDYLKYSLKLYLLPF